MKTFIPKTSLPTGEVKSCASGYGLDPGTFAYTNGIRVHGAWLMSYMFRRFGPPNDGSDPYKNLCQWTLTTPMPGVFLGVVPYLGDDPERGYPHIHSFRFEVESAVLPDHRASAELVEQIHQALLATMLELQVPVMVRDLAITITGRSDDYPEETADAFEDAGYPCTVNKDR